MARVDHVTKDWNAAADEVKRRHPNLAGDLSRAFADERLIPKLHKIEAAMREYRPTNEWPPFRIIDSYADARDTLLHLIAHAHVPLPASPKPEQQKRAKAAKLLKRAVDALDKVKMTKLHGVLHLHFLATQSRADGEPGPFGSLKEGELFQRFRQFPDMDLRPVLRTLAEKLEKFEPLEPFTDRDTHLQDPAIPQRGRKNANRTAFTRWTDQYLREVTGKPDDDALNELVEIVFDCSDEKYDASRAARRISRRK